MRTFAKDDVAHVRGLAPDPHAGLSDGAKADGWFLARKKTLTPMLEVSAGPEGLRFVTQDGEMELPAGWEGFVAVDLAGHPYPIEKTEQAKTYERVL